MIRLFVLASVVLGSMIFADSAEAGRWRHRRHYAPVVHRYRPVTHHVHHVHRYQVHRPVVAVPVYRTHYVAPVVPTVRVYAAPVVVYGHDYYGY